MALNARLTVEPTRAFRPYRPGSPLEDGVRIRPRRGYLEPTYFQGMVLDVALVGTAGTMPLPNRWLASVLLRYGRHLVLFDCGEGTQISLRKLGWGLKDIDLILISHVHGDHITGLPGLLLTQANSGRTEAVQILGPPGFSAVVAGLMVVAPHLPFVVRCHEMDSGDVFELDDLTTTCVAAEHHVAAWPFGSTSRAGDASCRTARANWACPFKTGSGSSGAKS